MFVVFCIIYLYLKCKTFYVLYFLGQKSTVLQLIEAFGNCKTKFKSTYTQSADLYDITKLINAASDFLDCDNNLIEQCR